MKDRTLQDILAAFPGKRVLVIGDVMLDEYIWGEVRRISPEAPVPVVKTQRRTYRPGGAGNAAANIAALGGLPLLCGVVGQDAMISQLVQALAENGVTINDGLIPSPDRPTTVKSRIVAQDQQMLRLDIETQQPISSHVEDAVLAWCKQHIDRTNVCILSDYAKGVLTGRVCQEIIGLVRSKNLPVVVDPKGQDYCKYAGATVVTPNAHEAAIATNHLTNAPFDLGHTAQYLLDQLAEASLLITQGAEGMSLYRHGQPRLHIPAKARNVYDVTGAGDTVVATLALALAAGAALEQAAHLANLAAGIVVGKFGTATVTRDELLAAIQ